VFLGSINLSQQIWLITPKLTTFDLKGNLTNLRNMPNYCDFEINLKIRNKSQNNEIIFSSIEKRFDISLIMRTKFT